MAKSKRKVQQQNLLQYFLNEFIFFRRDFVFETQLSPEQAAENLQQLNFENQGCWRSRRIIAEVNHEAEEITFELKTEQASRSSYSQSAKAEGIIYVDEQGTTLLEGTVTMGGLAYWLGLFFVLVFIIYIYLRGHLKRKIKWVHGQDNELTAVP
jgi:hypothetical protein